MEPVAMCRLLAKQTGQHHASHHSCARGEAQQDTLFSLQQLRREKSNIKWEIEMVGVIIATSQIECDNTGTLVFNELEQEHVNLAGLLNGVKFWAERFDVWQEILPFQIEHLQEVLSDHFPPLQWELEGDQL